MHGRLCRHSSSVARRTCSAEHLSKRPRMEIQNDRPSPVPQMITPGPIQPRRFILLFDLQTKHQSPSRRLLPCSRFVRERAFNAACTA